ncbi:NAD(P)-dependent dehydrogenase (short-subunit alcohol dehydrogenase family) [Microbacterium terrae]|uniref:3-oxoacyl-[acyl-carrier-protein] reductase FabG n=1 Tax=Microbacterium terrae TaxID=69369 RepID=A0A0M2HHV5_9MICO|nr:SDR family oxidoreductase [Microbacterium terrae]KJL43906.1 3-oxoacyl-[acyl-carrier-protein] reductase FabG [Microbacterium terrae]MBP1078685.1 NAD(P)-dependent dehydrogenase (short-subunit alcohol dehydrogenase family) [Microbacterium terrae]GLJ98086.1 oxidoreductase [Microbacterium terrae]
MELQLSGKTAFVSGSTQGIGFAIAAGLAAEGVRVVVNGRSSDGVDVAVEKLRAEYPDAGHSGLCADFAKPDEVGRLLEELGDVDILVNNVGLFGLAEFESVTDDEWARYLDVNVMSGVRLSRHLLGGMLQRGWGRVLFLGSESGVNVPADMVHYGVTKAAMIALGNGLAKLTRGTGVTVNTVLGGPTYSDGVAATVESIAGSQGAPVDAVKQAIIGQNRTTLLERFISPSEIANTVTYLASPLASATNGAAVRVDGGVLTAML